MLNCWSMWSVVDCAGRANLHSVICLFVCASTDDISYDYRTALSEFDFNQSTYFKNLVIVSPSTLVRLQLSVVSSLALASCCHCYTSDSILSHCVSFGSYLDFAFRWHVLCRWNCWHSVCDVFTCFLMNGDLDPLFRSRNDYSKGRRLWQATGMH